MADSASGRYIDLAISVRVADVERDESGRPHWKAGSDVELLRVGGRWDRRKKRWSPKAAKRLLILRFHRGQEEAIAWLVAWLKCFARNDWAGVVRVWSALLIGGRRSGKTHVCCAVIVIFAVLNPRAIIWAISPTLETGDELDSNFKEMLPRGWYRRRQAKTGRSTTYTLANGSRIMLKSAVKPQRLKAGRVDLALLNEAQELSQLAYVKLRAAIADRGGLVLLAANPPDTAGGRWVETHYYAAKAHEIDGVVFQLDPRLNPWINYEALASMAKEVDEKTRDRDLLGLFPPIEDVVLYAWKDDENWRDPPMGLVDITAEVARRELGRAAGDLIGMDFQRLPAMVGIVHRVFRDEKGEELLWIVDEAVIEEADENDLLDALEIIPRWRPGDRAPDKRLHSETYRGWADPADRRDAPVHCACVMDASGFYQDGEHRVNRTSEKWLRARGWIHLFPPEKNSDRNPPIVERVRVGNALLATSDGRHRLFVARHCKRTAEALKRYENTKFGAPNRRSEYAHIFDAVTYMAYRLYGKPKVPKAPLEYRGVGRFDRGDYYPR